MQVNYLEPPKEYHELTCCQKFIHCITCKKIKFYHKRKVTAWDVEFEQKVQQASERALEQTQRTQQNGDRKLRAYTNDTTT